MTFALVKSDPYKRRLRRRSTKFRTWNCAEWKRLIEIHNAGGDWVAYTVQLNRKLYEKRLEDL
jgi:hypothetical protein